MKDEGARGRGGEGKFQKEGEHHSG